MNEIVMPSAFGLARPADVEAIRRFEKEVMLRVPQADIPIEHHLHAGLYVRSSVVPAGMIATNVCIKIPTVVIISGSVLVSNGKFVQDIEGNQVILAFAGRKQVFCTRKETFITMCFATQAQTIEEAEAEFTDEVELLTSRRA
jgi:hypothetical protein